VRGAANRHVLAQVKRALEQVRVDIHLAEQHLKLVSKAPEGLVARWVDRQHNMALGLEFDPVLGPRQILSHQPKIQRMPRKRVEWHVRKPAQKLRQSFGLDHGAMRFTKSLDAAERVLPVVGAEVEVIQCHRFLVCSVVRLA